MTETVVHKITLKNNNPAVVRIELPDHDEPIEIKDECPENYLLVAVYPPTEEQPSVRFDLGVADDLDDPFGPESNYTYSFDLNTLEMIHEFIGQIIQENS